MDTKALFQQQRDATSYEEWLQASMEIDNQLGFNNWKSNDRSLLYDYKLIKYRLGEFKDARKAKDNRKLLYLIRTTLMRNLGNILSEQLYQNSYCGTKVLIEEYIKEITETITTLVNCNDIDNRHIMNTLVQTRKAFGRTALVLSGGATLGLLHAGVLFELEKQKLLPKIISGSSAGSIFAALFCTHKDDEFDELWPLLDRELQIFDRVGDEEGIFVRLKRFLISGTWIDNTYLAEMLQEMLGDVTFQEAYNRTGRILNVTVSSSGLHDMPRLLNYLTAPNVLLWSAVASSCSVPLIFASANLMAKDPSTGEIYSWTKATFIDGSVDNDLPLDRLAEMFNVNHFIACQVNPHIAPVLRVSEYLSVPTPKPAPDSLKDGDDDTEYVPDNSHQSPRWFRWGKSLLFNEISHGLNLLDQVGLMKNLAAKLGNLMGQEYIGNVTIIPRMEFGDFTTLLKNPTPEVMHKALVRGRQAIWPKIAIIHNNCAIEMALDTAVHKLRSQIISTGIKSASTRSMLRRRSEDGQFPHKRWSSIDLTQISPNRTLSRHTSHQKNNLASIRHSVSVNTSLNSYLDDSKHTRRMHRSANHSPALSRANSFISSKSGYTSPKGSQNSLHQLIHSSTDSFIVSKYYRNAGHESLPASRTESRQESRAQSPVASDDSDTETIRPESPYASP